MIELLSYFKNRYYSKHVVLPEFWQNAEVVWAIDLEDYKEEEGVG